MPSNYTGNAAAISARSNVVIATPVGSDVPNAASVNVPFDKLADYLQFLMNKAALLGVSAANNAQDLTLGGTFIGKHGSEAPASAGAYKEIGLFLTGNTAKVRFFVRGGGEGDTAAELLAAINCLRDGTDENWVRSDITQPALLVGYGADYFDVSFWGAEGTGFDSHAIFSLDDDGKVKIVGNPGIKIQGMANPVYATEPMTKGLLETLPTIVYPAPGDFLHSWESYDSGTNRFGYYKTRDNHVRFVGSIKSGSPTSSSVLVMPSGFRAAKETLIAVPSGVAYDGFAVAGFSPASSESIVVVTASGSGRINLSGLSYPADGS